MLIERFNTEEQARFYIEHSGGDFDEYVNEHHQFYNALQLTQKNLTGKIKNKILYRSYLSNYIVAENNIIVALGRDGLVANVAKYSNQAPIIGVNPDPERYDGVLLPYLPHGVSSAVSKVMTNKHDVSRVHLAEARLNDGQSILAFNDLFIGRRNHVSARYRIEYNEYEEHHSSSGIIVSTRAGATGWLSSMFNMTNGVLGLTNDLYEVSLPEMKSNQLMFVVREPYKSVSTQAEIVIGYLTDNQVLTIESMMPNDGVIFSDGMEKDFVHFNSGAKVEIGLSSTVANLVQ
jgi:hypothetical protein